MILNGAGELQGCYAESSENGRNELTGALEVQQWQMQSPAPGLA